MIFVHLQKQKNLTKLEGEEKLSKEDLKNPLSEYTP